MSKKHNYDWDVLIQEQKESGMNMKKFCEYKEISYSAFKNNIYKNKMVSSSSITFIPIKKVETKQLSLTIDGHRLSLDSEMDDDSIKRILKAFIS